jgi:hypothetical protein
MVHLGGEYTVEIIIYPVFNHDAGTLQEFSLVLTNFIISNTASYDNDSSSMGFSVRVHCVI